MGLIHQPGINKLVRSILRPFSGILSPKFKFAVDGIIDVDLGEGKSMKFQGNATSPMLRMLYWDGIKGFEPHEYPIFVHLAKRSNVFFDIGANIGYYSLVAKTFNPKILIHGFEPMPSANKYFHLNKEINHFENLNIHDVALTNFEGKAEFHSNLNPKFPEIKDHLYGDSSLNSKATSTISRIKFDVKTDTLDNFCSKNLEAGKKIDLIKMDTEGTEDLVMAGSKIVLKEHRPIIMCEVIKGFTEKEVQAALDPFDYLFFEVTPQGLKKVTDLIVEKGKNDYFFVPKEKEGLVKELVA
jgi:FkbM family methyltransferase